MATIDSPSVSVLKQVSFSFNPFSLYPRARRVSQEICQLPSQFVLPFRCSGMSLKDKKENSEIFPLCLFFLSLPLSPLDNTPSRRASRSRLPRMDSLDSSRSLWRPCPLGFGDGMHLFLFPQLRDTGSPTTQKSFPVTPL